MLRCTFARAAFVRTCMCCDHRTLEVRGRCSSFTLFCSACTSSQGQGVHVLCAGVEGACTVQIIQPLQRVSERKEWAQSNSAGAQQDCLHRKHQAQGHAVSARCLVLS